MIEPILSALSAPPNAIALLCGLVAVGWLYSRRRPAWVAQLPVLSHSGLVDSKAAVMEGYEKYTKHGKLWKLRNHDHELIMLPLDWMDDIRNRPVTEASAIEEIEDRFLGRYSTIGHHQPLFLHVLRAKMVPMSNSTASIRLLLNECEHAVRDDIGECSDWKSFALFAFCSRIMCRMMGRMGGGTELGHDPEWLQLAGQQVMTCAAVCATMLQWPWYCRPFVAPFTKPMREMKAGQKKMQKLVEPLVEQRKQLSKSEPEILQMLMDAQQMPNTKELADSMVDLALFSILTTTMTVTDVLLHMAAHPKYQSLILEEILQILDGRPFGQLTQGDLVKMSKLDSFIRETLRVTPSGYGLSRKIKTSTIRLPNGNFLPRGCFVSTPTAPIAREAKYWPNPDEFDALRFHKLRQQPGEERKHQVVSLDKTHFTFGDGPGACPGRFLVINEVKILTAFVLLHYDLKTNVESKDDPSEYGTKTGAQIFFRSK
ncbi:cytochrome P450 [Thozetella sp. PMI_491]|nr:cytochrome P450 [Thozetella sp. PMI_491]